MLSESLEGQGCITRCW